MKKIICLSFFVSVVCSLLVAQPLVTQKRVLKLMDSRFGLTAVATSDSIALAAIEAGVKEIERIEHLLSASDSTSMISQINQNAGKEAIKVNQELFDLFMRAKKISRLTEGAFDISYASIEKIWQFDGSMDKLPSPEDIEASVAKIHWEHIILNKRKRTVLLQEKGMKVNMGGIQKGYAANRAKLAMVKFGIRGGLVNAGGDLLAWGEKASGKRWKINIANPQQQKSAIAWVHIKDLAVVTSGNYNKFALIDGKRYAHIIDPRTGYPISNIKSVTVISPDAELADALSTAVFVMGIRDGLELINSSNNMECLIVDKNDKLIISDGLILNYY